MTFKKGRVCLVLIWNGLELFLIILRWGGGGEKALGAVFGDLNLIWALASNVRVALLFNARLRYFCSDSNHKVLALCALRISFFFLIADTVPLLTFSYFPFFFFLLTKSLSCFTLVEAFSCCERWICPMTAGFWIYIFLLLLLFLHVVKCDNKGNILWSTCAECLWKQFFCSLRYRATAASFNEPPRPRVAATLGGGKVLCEVFCILRSCVRRCTVPRIWLRIRRTWGSCGTTREGRAGAPTFTGGCGETERGRCAHRTVQTRLTSPDSAAGIRRTVTTAAWEDEKMLTSCGLLALGGVGGINSFCQIHLFNSWVLIWYKCSWNSLVGQTAILI